jgi:outer membrane receptor protein involved in Fe transport
MLSLRTCGLACAVVVAWPLAAQEVGTDPVVAQATPAPPPQPASGPSAQTLDKVLIVGARQRLDEARNGLSPDTGSTVYRFSKEDLANLPLGDSTPLNQVILQSPGVVQDSFGQLHVRGDHSNVQYRINGVLIPEAISGFGQALETRFADHISLITGALPAQYGYRTAAVVDIHARDPGLENGGRAALTVGSYGHVEPSLELFGSSGAFSYYLTGSYLGNKIGIENPTPERTALHDETHQTKAFGNLSYLLDPQSRISLLFGTTNNRFEIPNVPGQTPSFTLDTAPVPDSANLDARQRERNNFVVLSYQNSVATNVDYQLSIFNRITDVHYTPDPAGDLAFNGIAAEIMRRNVANGVQADLAWRLGAAHTLRGGLFAQRERFTVDNNAQVFPADADGNQTSGVPIAIQDNSRIDGHLWGVYAQDEWQPTEKLTVNYGLRYDQVNTVVDESQLSPRVGLVYDVSKDLRLHAGYARYFTPPPTEKIDTTSIAKFEGTTNALPSDANTAVKSERSHYFDAGAAYQLTPQITLGIDGYYRKVQHLQDEGQFGNALIFSAFNFRYGEIGGVDLTASYRDKALSGYVNVGFQRARGKQVETGQFNFDPDELDYIAQNWVHLDHEQAISASGGIAYRWADGWLTSADALYGSGLRRGFANTEHLPSYTVFNAAVARTLQLGAGVGALDLRLAVQNVFDRVYQLRDGSGIGVGAPQFGLRRAFYATIGKTF